jgi:hypothetical protein
VEWGGFTIAMATMVGNKGKVIAPDLQQKMLEVLVQSSWISPDPLSGEDQRHGAMATGTVGGLLRMVKCRHRANPGTAW